MMIRRVLNGLEKVKTRLINLSLTLLKSEKATKKEIKRVKAALKEYKKGKTTPVTKFYL
jgi:hypothetical protein